VEKFAKFMVATPEFLDSHFRNDLDNLTLEGETRQSMNDIMGVGFVEGAKNKIREQITLTETFNTIKMQDDIDDIQRILSRVQTNHALSRSRLDLSAQNMGLDMMEKASGSNNVDPLPLKLPPPQRTSRRNVNPSFGPGSYYFYMAANGRHVFLHPLDIRILLAKYTKYSLFPPQITLPVEAYVESSVDADLRKRCKYLAHLPEGSDVVFVETKLETIVDNEILQPFEQALKQRRSKRVEKDRKDERARVKAEEIARERERELGVWRDIDRIDFQPHASEPAESTEETPISEVPAAARQEGVWGNRSFANAANSGARRETNPGRSEVDFTEIDNHNFDVAWHELEERATQRKGRLRQLVVLGGGGGGRRHR
jgi:hypothetical protein